MSVDVRGKRWWGVASLPPSDARQMRGVVVRDDEGEVRRRNRGEGGRGWVREEIGSDRAAASHSAAAHSAAEVHGGDGRAMGAMPRSASKVWRRRVMCGPIFLSVALLLLGRAPSVQSQAICPGGVPCVVDKGGASFDNSEYITTAVGCSETVDVKFGSSIDSTSSPTVSMCERDAEGKCNYKSGVILNQFQRDCCAIAFVQRKRACIASTMADDPNGNFQCIQLSYTIEAGYVTAHITFFGSYSSDLVNGGQVEACLTASHGNSSATSEPYCILFLVQRCSVCLQKGEGLASVAKRYGSHWTQVYSANPSIKGNPDDLDVNQLVRLGNQYTVKAGDTLVALALKFGVSVNQIFVWNPHLVPLSDLGGKGDKDYLARLLPIGHELCILPKTCMNTFGASQPVYDLGDPFQEGHGGSWADPPQVVPTVVDLKDVNYGPGGGYYGS